MSLSVLRSAILAVATISTGLMAGVFALYAHTIMPGLKKADDRTFIAAFQALDRAIINPWFIGATFIAALLFTAGAAFANIGRSALPWVVAALVLYLVAVVITFTVHVPLNDAIKAAGDPNRLINLAEIRAQFNEAKWAAWNLVRVMATLAAFAALVWALILHGRSTVE
jgi:uncharacterized membrane protein